MVLAARTSLPSLTFTFLALLLVGCSNGGGDDESQGDLSRNACPVLGLNSRIISGTECGESNSPIVQVNIVTVSGERGICSGTLITRDDVLTAAHCFFDGVRSVTVEVANQSATVVEVIDHPQVSIDPLTGATFNDVSILRLQAPLNAPTLPLLRNRRAEIGDTISIFGYGLDNEGRLEVLRSGQMEISSVDQEFIGAFFGGEGSNTCNGDSGGPAILSFTNADGIGINGIVGVVSSGTSIDCLEGDTTFFANVQKTSVLNFITQTVPDVQVR